MIVILTRDTATLTAATARYLDHVLEKLSPLTHVEYARVLNTMVAVLDPEMLVSAVRVEHLSAEDGGVMRRWPAATSSANTRAKSVTALRMFFEYCTKKGWADGNPARLLERPKRPDKKGPYFEWRDVQRLIELVRQEGTTRDLAIILLAAYCGLRISSISRLCWKDVNFETSTITVWLKRDREEELAIPAILRAVLRTLVEDVAPNNRPSDPVIQQFTSGRRYPVAAKPLTTEGLRRFFKRWFQRAGLPWEGGTGTGGHSMRRSFARELTNRGWDVARIANALCHKDPSTTIRHYAFPPEDEQRRMVEDLSRPK
jgi:integrase/recombinase XerD